MAENTTNKDRLKEITDSIESGIKDLFQSDRYMQYLRTMSRFHKYSVNNTMLIYMQRPDATLVAGFNKWKDQFSRSVMKGEKGIKIIAPTPFKKKIEEQKLDPDTKMPMLDSDGKVVMEEKTVQIPMYKVVSVFDVAQTDGKPLPTIAADLAGNVQNYEVFMEALRRSAPVPIAIEKMTADMDGFFSPDNQRIAIREGMSEVQTVSATVHEIAHSKLHNYQQAQEQAAAGDETAAPVKKKDRNTEEVEAESISYAICAYYSIATGDNSFGYIATWSENKELPELRASLETINKTASGLITDIDRNYAAICKERGIDQTKEPEKQPGYEEWSEPATAQNAPEMPDTPSDDVSAYLPQEQPLDGERIVDVKIETYDPNAPLPPFPADYPMPDPTVTIADRDAYGYTENDMLPLSHDKAAEFFLKDETIYMLDPGNSAGMAFDMDDIDHHNGLFGIRREDWDNEREYLELAEGHEITDQEVENSFLHNPADAFAIYQLKSTEKTRDLRFEPLERVTAVGLTVERENYDCVYTGGFDRYSGRRDRLEELWDTFNNHIPEDFRHHSLSVSDIVAIKESGKVSYHYVDSYDFTELPAFQKPENYLKNAEMAMEDDYGMIDGIVNNGMKQPTVAELEQQAKSGTPISLMDLAAAVHREQGKEKKPSVLEQLKSHEAKEKSIKTAPKRSAEREL